MPPVENTKKWIKRSFRKQATNRKREGEEGSNLTPCGPQFWRLGGPSRLGEVYGMHCTGCGSPGAGRPSSGILRGAKWERFAGVWIGARGGGSCFQLR